MWCSIAATPSGRISDIWVRSLGEGVDELSRSTFLLQIAHMETISLECVLGLTTVFILSVIVTMGGGGGGSVVTVMFLGFSTNTSILQCETELGLGAGELMLIQHGPISFLLMMKFSRVEVLAPKILSKC